MSESNAINVEESGQFGNYLIHGIDEISLPEPVSLWPSTIGWKLLALALAAYAILKMVQSARRWWRNRYRREALRRLSLLASDAQLAALPVLLKATALQAYPREQVAALSGDAWLEFMDTHCVAAPFEGDIGKNLLDIAYRPKSQLRLSESQVNALMGASRIWIEHHV